MTRFSRVTFNAAHKYLGLTTEVLRTEKAINDIECHPLPAAFYEGGGMQQLRQRFDRAGSEEPADSGPDYFSRSPSSTAVSSKPYKSNPLPKFELADNVVPIEKRPVFSPMRTRSPRHMVQAGDLHSSTAHSNDAYRPLHRSLSILSTPHIPRHTDASAALQDSMHFPEVESVAGDDFDLRQEVMNCIAVSIGLLQPPLSGDASVEASPAFSPTDSGPASRGGVFASSFGSLSLLDMADDASSATGTSSVTANGYMSGLDNEVEILFFNAGSYLAKAGEKNTGEFAVPLNSDRDIYI